MTASQWQARSCWGKERYTSRRFAEEVRHRAERREGEPLKVYGCPECGGFHLTGRVRERRQAQFG